MTHKENNLFATLENLDSEFYKLLVKCRQTILINAHVHNT